MTRQFIIALVASAAGILGLTVIAVYYQRTKQKRGFALASLWGIPPAFAAVNSGLKMRQLWRFENVPLTPLMTRSAS